MPSSEASFCLQSPSQAYLMLTLELLQLILYMIFIEAFEKEKKN